jgi:hypothetical protein
MTQPAIAEAMGVSFSTVNRAHMAYDRRDQGAQAGGRPRRELCSSALPGPAGAGSTSAISRHGLGKLMPRPFHPKGNVPPQNAFRGRFSLGGTAVEASPLTRTAALGRPTRLAERSCARLADVICQYTRNRPVRRRMS